MTVSTSYTHRRYQLSLGPQGIDEAMQLLVLSLQFAHNLFMAAIDIIGTSQALSEALSEPLLDLDLALDLKHLNDGHFLALVRNLESMA